MKKLSKIIISMGIILVILLIVVMFLLNNLESKREISKEEEILLNEESVGLSIEEEQKKLSEENNRDFYFNIKNCFDKYLETVFSANNKEYMNYMLSDVSQVELKNRIIALLSKEYINNNNITVDNLGKFIIEKEERMHFSQLQFEKIKDGSVTSYAVYGILMDWDFNIIDYIYFVINFDVNNLTFSIEFIEPVEDLEKVKMPEISEIEKNDYNSYTKPMKTTEIICLDYIDQYKKIAIAAPEKFYELLNKEYREARFGNVNNFKKYIEDNRDSIYLTSLNQYEEINRGEYTTYICKDNNNKDYVINEKSCMDFEFLLDIYTVPVPELVEKYNTLNDEEKVNFNINMIILAINDNNYKYLYDKLNDTFKKNNFNDLDNFETYLEKKLYNNNKAEHVDVYMENNVYINSINIQDLENESNVTDMTIIMKLNEEENFEISLNIE